MCENTFKLLLGAIDESGDNVMLRLNNFESKEKNIRAMVYYLDHAAKGKCVFSYGPEKFRLIDVPYTYFGEPSTPVKIVLQLGNPDLLLKLLRYGAVVSEDPKSSGLELLMKRIKENKGDCSLLNLVLCLKFLLRVVIRVRVSPTLPALMGSNLDREGFSQKFPELVGGEFVPESRCGFRPPELKHLCRCTIRHRLWTQFQLPHGIRKTPLPETLHKYLDLLED